MASTLPARFATRALLALMLVLGSAPGAFAQSKDVFLDVQKHFEGYQAAQLGDFSDLYDFRPYTSLHHQWVSHEKLAELRATWKAELARVAERIEKIETEPRERYLYRLERKLRKHPYFKETEYTRRDEFAPFVLYVTRPSKDRPKYDEQVARAYGPWLQAIEKIFREEYAEPLGLERNELFESYPMVLLGSMGDYVNYAQSIQTQDLNRTRAHYSPHYRWAVTYQNKFRTQGQPLEDRRSALHECVHMLQHAYSKRTDERALAEMPTWFNEGWAEYLSYHSRSSVAELEKHVLDVPAARSLSRANRNGNRLPRIARMIEYKSYYEIQRSGVQLIDFYNQAAIFVHFLHSGEGGKYRGSTLQYIGKLLKGEGKDTTEAFKTSFAAHDLDELDKAFWKFVGEHSEDKRLAKGPRRKPLKKKSKKKGSGAAVDAGASVAAGPAALKAALDTPELRLSEALCAAADGDVEGALETLAALKDVDAPKKLKKRIEGEHERLESWQALQTRFLDDLAARGGKVKLEQANGSSVRGKVSAIEESELVLDDGGEERRVALSTITPYSLAREMKNFDAPPAVRYWAYVIAGAKTWPKLLKRAKGKEPERLAADGNRFYPGALRAGRVARSLRALAEAEEPSNAREARKTLEKIQAILEEGKGVDVVKTCKPGLAGLALSCLEHEFEDTKLDDLLVAPAEDLGDGRVRLRYDFRDAAQMKDFVAEDPVPDERERHGATQIQRSASFIRREGNGLLARGQASLRHVLPFQSPMRMSYKVKWRGNGMGQAFTFAAGICTDDKGNHAWAVHSGTLEIIDKSGFIRQEFDNTTVMLGSTYAMEIVHDGSEITVSCDGVEKNSAPCGPRTSGMVFLWVHSDIDVEISSLVIEGTTDRETLRGDWTARRMAELGLK